MRDAALIGAVPPPGLHVMTFNIRRRVPHLGRTHPDRWDLRAPRVAELLRAERPTVLGVQEALPDQAALVLANLGPRYRVMGVGRRRDGGGEACPLFVDTGRLRVRGWRQLALSDRPDAAGSMLPGALAPRVLVRVELADLATGARFAVINTHFDPFGGRVRSARMTRATAGPEPTVVLGDLNAAPGSRTVRALLHDGLRDGWAAARRRLTPEWGTHARYRPPGRGRRIDWIAVSAGVTVERIGIHGDRVAGGWASDHLPVQAVLRVDR